MEALKGRHAGKTLWSFNSAHALQQIRGQLQLMGYSEGASKFTWKSFRGGKAMDLLQSGLPIGEILLEGEWAKKSRAWMRYADIDAYIPPENPIQLFDNKKKTTIRTMIALEGSDGMKM